MVMEIGECWDGMWIFDPVEGAGGLRQTSTGQRDGDT